MIVVEWIVSQGFRPGLCKTAPSGRGTDGNIYLIFSDARRSVRSEKPTQHQKESRCELR